jgi:hypothetical protein
MAYHHYVHRGGKVAMAQALSEPDSISKLIVIDITPARAGISSDFVKYVDAMREVQNANVSSKKEGDKILQPYEEVRASKTKISGRKY